MDVGVFNARRLCTALRLDYTLGLWALTSASRAVSVVAELLVAITRGKITRSGLLTCNSSLSYKCYCFSFSRTSASQNKRIWLDCFYLRIGNFRLCHSILSRKFLPAAVMTFSGTLTDSLL